MKTSYFEVMAAGRPQTRRRFQYETEEGRVAASREAAIYATELSFIYDPSEIILGASSQVLMKDMTA